MQSIERDSGAGETASQLRFWRRVGNPCENIRRCANLFLKGAAIVYWGEVLAGTLSERDPYSALLPDRGRRTHGWRRWQAPTTCMSRRQWRCTWWEWCFAQCAGRPSSRTSSRISNRRLFPVVVIGYMANNLLPMRLGEVVRSYYLGEREDISKSSALATIFIERVFDALTLLFFVAVVAVFVPLGGLTTGFRQSGRHKSNSSWLPG